MTWIKKLKESNCVGSLKAYRRTVRLNAEHSSANLYEMTTEERNEKREIAKPARKIV
jgi:hypothetical protein